MFDHSSPNQTGHAYRLRCYGLFAGVVLAMAAGCSSEPPVFNEVKHPHELLKVSELNTYLKIVHNLPGQKLPPLPALLAAAPEWDLNREMSIKGLVQEEQRRNTDRWFTDTLITQLDNNRPLQKLLKKHNLSTEQFVGLTETINIAAARRHVDDLMELHSIVRNGQHEINQMLKRDEVFSSVSEPEQYELIRQAAWITRVSRAQELLRVPDENVALVTKHLEILDPYLHADTQRHPLDDVVDLLKYFGLPFEEQAKTGLDANLRWSPDDADALIGHASEKQLAIIDPKAKPPAGMVNSTQSRETNQ